MPTELMHAKNRSHADLHAVLHEFLASVQRQRKTALAVFAVIFACVLVFGWLLSDHYRAQMEFMMEEAQPRRAEPVVSSGLLDQLIVNQQETLNEEQLNSEIALIRSHDVLRQAVLACGLQNRPSLLDELMGRTSEDQKIERAVDRLAARLEISVMKMSDVIVVSYRSSDPQLAARVLQSLGVAYMREHALVHRPPGGYAFFHQQTIQAHGKLEETQQELVDFTHSQGIAAADVELKEALQQVTDVEAAQAQTQAEIADTHRRLTNMDTRFRSLPSREMTQLRVSDNGLLLQQLKPTLLSLELKRTELLTKFQPDYPAVQEVDEQIEQAKQAIADAEKKPLQDKTTDRDPSYEMMRQDLMKTDAELAGLEARSTVLAKQLSDWQGKVQWLQKEGIAQQNLLLNEKQAEDNYNLYLHKEEEARISDALDKRGILNVTIAQAPIVPALPSHSAPWYFVIGSLLGLVGGIGAAVLADKLDPTLRTPEEVEWMLNAPLLAALPWKSDVVAPAAPQMETPLFRAR
jgi:uncharacterized protein involved in exopolysaccharide biosynthesis